jgi:hypothetical protein
MIDDAPKVRECGNVLFKGTAEFSVDTACIGLHMLISSLLTGMIPLYRPLMNWTVL